MIIYIRSRYAGLVDIGSRELGIEAQISQQGTRIHFTQTNGLKLQNQSYKLEKLNPNEYRILNTNLTLRHISGAKIELCETRPEE